MRTNSVGIELKAIIPDDIELNQVDLNRIYLHIASSSDNPAVMDALKNLVLTVQLSETEFIAKHIEYLKTITEIAHSRLLHINADECHEMIDDVLARGNNNSIFALENFVDVARQSKSFKKKRH